MQVSTRVEENARNAPASSSRSGSSPPTIASVMEKLQSALQKSRIDRATARPTAEGWSWALVRGRTVRVGRPSVVWLCGTDGWSPVRA